MTLAGMARGHLGRSTCESGWIGRAGSPLPAAGSREIDGAHGVARPTFRFMGRGSEWQLTTDFADFADYFFSIRVIRVICGSFRMLVSFENRFSCVSTVKISLSTP
jgi:hypothetical protein